MNKNRWFSLTLSPSGNAKKAIEISSLFIFQTYKSVGQEQVTKQVAMKPEEIIGHINRDINVNITGPQNMYTISGIEN